MAKQKPIAGKNLLVGTRKGAFRIEGSADRRSWNITGPEFLGQIVNHWIQDPRDPKTQIIAAKAGHLGPTIFVSKDAGKNWKEAKKPPAFPMDKNGNGLKVSHTFWLAPGHASEKGTFWAGTSPQGIFSSEDGGISWESVKGFNENPMRAKWVGDEGGIPDGPAVHSILIDPRDANHMYFGMSIGGFFESRDRGASWAPLNKGCEANFIPDPDPEYGHDPHCVQMHSQDPDLLYQQNHCGIYKMVRSEGKWDRIGNNMPKHIGDIGFPIVLHPRDTEKVWVFPMDGTSVWPRTSPEGKPATYMTKNGGKTWKRQNKGLPGKQAWFTVKRQCMTHDNHARLGLYFGTTSGEVWASKNEGDTWRCIAKHLPHIYSVEMEY